MHGMIIGKNLVPGSFVFKAMGETRDQFSKSFGVAYPLVSTSDPEVVINEAYLINSGDYLALIFCKHGSEGLIKLFEYTFGDGTKCIAIESFSFKSQQ